MKRYEEMNMNVVDAKGIRRQVEFVHSAPWQTDISDMEYPLKLTLVLKKVTPNNYSFATENRETS